MRAVLAALAAGVLPGYFWAGFVRRTDGVGERLAYSAAFSLAAVPAIALVLAKIAGTGVSLAVAIAAVVIVAGSGALACRLRGFAGGSAEPALPRPRPVRDGRVLALLVAAIGLALAFAFEVPAPRWLLLVVLAALLIAGLSARAGTKAHGPVKVPEAADRAAARGARPLLSPALRAPVLAAILALTAVRGYAGVIRHDWPYLRGQDMFSHAVMTEQMLSHGSYSTYLVYPPGFSTMSAVICRLCGLAPLSLFPVLAPAILLLTTIAAYALVTRLWGWDYGLVAAALSGLVLIGPYVSFGGGLYPDLLSAFFLMVMLIAALVTLYQSPSVRSGLMVAVTGAAVVLYHSVGTLYLVLLLAGVAVTGLPYLLLRGGREGRALARALALALGALGALSLAYAWYIYGLGHILSGAGGTKATVGLDVGSQPVLKASDLLAWVGAPVIWLGVFGFAVLAAAIRHLRRPGQVLCALTVLAWCLVMYAGSRTAGDGFPQRFERDVGGPLTILAALGLGLVLQSLLQLRPGMLRAGMLRPGRLRPGKLAVAVLTGATAALVVFSAGLQARTDMISDSRPSREVTPVNVARAGEWLQRHNTGGTIISTPDMNRGITNRAVLAMGGYTGLQSYPERKIEHPRSLPTAGRGPLLDSRQVLLDPATCESVSIVVAEDVRYIVLYKYGNEANFAAFRADPAQYQPVFENPSVIIYEPRRAKAVGCDSPGPGAGGGSPTTASVSS